MPRIARLIFAFVLSLFFFAVGFFYVFHVPAVFLGSKGNAFTGVADRADGVGVDVDVLRVGRRDLEAIEKEAGAAGIELIGGEGLENWMSASWMEALSSTGGRSSGVRSGCSQVVTEESVSPGSAALPTGMVPWSMVFSAGAKVPSARRGLLRASRLRRALSGLALGLLEVRAW